MVSMEPKEIAYKRQVRKDGGSMEVSIPIEIIESFSLKNHDPVYVVAVKEGILIKKVME